ncbi:MAG: ABC transporter ATP-binding protein, partial [Actinomycetota bacterium]
ALAVMGSPEVLFLDEPTTGLDPESRRNTWQLVRNLLEDGTTILLTTHYLEEAEALADRLAIMHGGRIVTAGTAAEIAAAQPARISFQLPDDARARDELPALSGRVQVDGTQVTVHTETLQHALTELLAWANPKGLELGRLNVRSASLEEAFMAVAAGDYQAELTGEVVA